MISTAQWTFKKLPKGDVNQVSKDDDLVEEWPVASSVHIIAFQIRAENRERLFASR